MANFSTLFPNLQGGLDFTVGSTTGTANQIYGWAQADDLTKIPKNKLPDISLGHTYTFTTNAATEALAIAAYTALFAAGGGTEANGAITGDVLDAGDLVIITYTGGSSTMMLHLLYTGAQVTAGTDTPLDAAFINVTAGVTLTAGTNTSVGSDGTSIDLNANIAGLTNINTTAATALILGNAGATLNIDASTFDVDATSVDITSTGNAVFAAGNNGVATLSAGTGAGAEVDITSAGTSASAIDINATAGGIDIDAAGLLQLSSNIASGVAIDIDATQSAGTININAVGSTGVGSIVVDAGAGELRLGGEGIGASGFLQVNADGHVTTGAASVGSYGFANLSDSNNQTCTVNSVNMIAPFTQARNVALPVSTTAGEWVKIINNNISSGFAVTLTSAQGFVGTEDGTLVLDDISANIELVYTGTGGTGSGSTFHGWAVISS